MDLGPALLTFLGAQPLILLFTVIGLGYLAGSLRVAGVTLGVAGVLFAGLLLGALDPRLELPPLIYEIGLVLFVYCVGLQSGPGFFASFRHRGLPLNGLATGIATAGALLAAGLGVALQLDGAGTAGLYCGALTTTPALAAAVDAVRALAGDFPATEAAARAARPVVAYGLTYPLGVFGVLLTFELTARLCRIDFPAEEARRRAAAGAGELRTLTFHVTEPAAVGRTMGELMVGGGAHGFAFSRLRRGEEVSVATPDTRLAAGDLVLVVGSREALARAGSLLGPEIPGGDLDWMSEELMHRRILVSNREVVGRRLDELGLDRLFPAVITRLRRGDIDFVPRPDTILDPGDRIRVVAPRRLIPTVSRFFGDSLRDISETDFLAVSLGLLAGLLLGLVPVPLPNGLTFRLGFAGGPLLVGLLLGWRHRTGPLVWSLPYTVNMAVRQFGLVLFLAVIGLRAGGGFARTIADGGGLILLSGLLVTTAVAVTGLLAAWRGLRLPFPVAMGLVAAIATQPAALEFATRKSGSDAPQEGYTAVYPAVMITKILLAQLLVTMFPR